MTGWAATVTTISTAFIAIAVVILTVAIVTALRRMETLSNNMERLLETLDRDARPALEAVRRTADEASRVAILVRDEAEGVAGSAKKLRGRVDRTAGALEERFIEFETLLDLLQEEVEDTVLDVAAALRTTRRGSGIVRTMKRAFKKKRRRR